MEPAEPGVREAVEEPPPRPRLRWRSLLRDNPVLGRELRRLRRSWVSLALVVVGLWLPLAFLSRGLMGQWVMAAWWMAWWQILLLEVFQLAFRADMLVGFFLIYRFSQRSEWVGARDQWVVTLLTPMEILAGKAVVPLMVVFALNLTASPAYYWDLIVSDEFWILLPDWGDQVVSAGGLVMPFAMLEDLFFAALIVVAGLRAYLLTENALLATAQAIGWTMVAGLGVAVCGLAPDFLILIFLPVRLTNAELFLLGNSLFFALALPWEWWLLRRWSRGLGRAMPEWLGQDAGD